MATLQPLRTPAAYTQPNVIYFESRCHSDSENFFSFLTLPAYDPSSNAPAGLTLGVALDACQIAHCNEPGFLSTSTDRSDDAARTGTDRSTILTSSTYYYHLADSNALPTICSSFLVWTPPIAPQREDLSINIHADWFCDDRSATAPVINTANWTTLSERFKGTYDSCCLSGWRDCLTSAHLIPKVNLSWFREHCMERFAKEDEHEVNDVRNLVPLRGDLRIFGFDQAQFVFVPKNGCIVAHFIQRTSESANVYHNRVINTASTSPAYLYCRFAWAILHRVNRQTYPGCRAKLKIKVANSLRTVIGCLESTVNFTTGIGKIISDTSEMCMDVDSSIGEAVDDAMSFQPVEEDINNQGTLPPLLTRSGSGCDKSDPPPDLSDPKARYFYNNLTWHSEVDKMDKLRQQYFEEHPNVRATLAAEFATDLESDDEDDVLKALEEKTRRALAELV